MLSTFGALSCWGLVQEGCTGMLGQHELGLAAPAAWQSGWGYVPWQAAQAQLSVTLSFGHRTDGHCGEVEVSTGMQLVSLLCWCAWTSCDAAGPLPPGWWEMGVRRVPAPLLPLLELVLFGF